MTTRQMRGTGFRCAGGAGLATFDGLLRTVDTNVSGPVKRDRADGLAGLTTQLTWSKTPTWRTVCATGDAEDTFLTLGLKNLGPDNCGPRGCRPAMATATGVRREARRAANASLDCRARSISARVSTCKLKQLSPCGHVPAACKVHKANGASANLPRPLAGDVGCAAASLVGAGLLGLPPPAAAASRSDFAYACRVATSAAGNGAWLKTHWGLMRFPFLANV